MHKLQQKFFSLAKPVDCLSRSNQHLEAKQFTTRRVPANVHSEVLSTLVSAAFRERLQAGYHRCDAI